MAPGIATRSILTTRNKRTLRTELCQVSITWLTNDTRDDPSSCDEAAVAWVSGPLTENEEPNEGNGSIPEWRIVGSCLRLGVVMTWMIWSYIWYYENRGRG